MSDLLVSPDAWALTDDEVRARLEHVSALLARAHAMTSPWPESNWAADEADGERMEYLRQVTALQDKARVIRERLECRGQPRIRWPSLIGKLRRERAVA